MNGLAIPRFGDVETFRPWKPAEPLRNPIPHTDVYWGSVPLVAFEGYANVGQGHSIMDLHHPQVERVREQLAKWPEAYEFFGIVDFITPLDNGSTMGRGSMSGHDEPRAGHPMTLYVSLNDTVGGADGLLHELVHQRCHLLGMNLEDHDARVLEPVGPAREDGRFADPMIYFSPIRRDCLRPMTAVIHAVLAWAWMLQNELRAPDGVEYLVVNVPKVRRGIREVRDYAKASGPFGRAFLAEMGELCDRVVAEGEDVIRQAGRSELLPPNEDPANWI